MWLSQDTGGEDTQRGGHTGDTDVPAGLSPISSPHGSLTTSGITAAAEMWRRIKWEVLNKSSCLASRTRGAPLWCLALWDSGREGAFCACMTQGGYSISDTAHRSPGYGHCPCPQYCCDFAELKETERLGISGLKTGCLLRDRGGADTGQIHPVSTYHVCGPWLRASLPLCPGSLSSWS